MRILNHDSKYSILDCVYAKSRRDSWFEMRISNHGPEVFSSYASQITNLDVLWRTHGPIYRISNRDSRCASRITIQNTHFAVVWKQSQTLWVHLKSMNYPWFDFIIKSRILKGYLQVISQIQMFMNISVKWLEKETCQAASGTVCQCISSQRVQESLWFRQWHTLRQGFSNFFSEGPDESPVHPERARTVFGAGGGGGGAEYVREAHITSAKSVAAGVQL